MIPQGQITPGTAFGQALTEQAKKADIIVEVGTWYGLGSTLCFVMGMERPTQRLVSIECDWEKHIIAVGRYNDPRLTFLCGVVTREMDNLTSPKKRDVDYHEAERVFAQGCPVIYDQIPETIDLLLLDGGEWSSGRILHLLMPRTKVIALDDVRVAKNAANRRFLLYDPKFRLVKENIKDRNGWSIFERI